MRPNKAENSSDYKAKIVHAYDSSELAYRLTWNLQKSRAIHYGYRDATTKSFTDTLQRMNEVVCARAQISSSDRVLDAGCGIGGSAIFLAESMGCHVTGVNLSQRQVELARFWANKQNVTQLTRFEVADFEALPFPNHSFSVVWAIESIFHATDKQPFLSEAYRVLQPGGRLVIADYLQDRFPQSPPEEKWLKRWFNGYAIPSLPTWETFQKQSERVGFEALHHRDMSQYIRASSKRLYWLGKIAHATWPLCGTFMKRQGMNKAQPLSLIAQYECLKRHLWKYALIYAEKPSA